MTKLTKIEKCRECGSTSLTWFTYITCVNEVPHNKQNASDMACRFVLGCNDCADTLMVASADKVADWLNREEPAAPVASINPAVLGDLASIAGLSGVLRQGGPAPEDLQELSEALAIAHDAVAAHPEPDAAVRDVLAERKRQIEAEGWTPERDDAYTGGQLAAAGAAYSIIAHKMAETGAVVHPACWPWDASWLKPGTPRRNLIKAGALIVAEIQRIDRAEARAKTEGGNGNA
ncbi:hypothetical protein BJP27_24410 (plasmid) [Pseudomonas oryzihabitans]|nr:hypothetical protein BJP27_24410 [Pseudomonas psychrotolerans]